MGVEALEAWIAWAVWVALEGGTWHQLAEWEVSLCFPLSGQKNQVIYLLLVTN